MEEVLLVGYLGRVLFPLEQWLLGFGKQEAEVGQE